ncbi:MAG: MBL fold metallo-hydrolase [Candidatus Methanomethyliaceae archaeon]|nr:MBL fold metallo-hydrolase [Candidatus Methanomethyliaceae archaeon]MDW7971096.1 MBL fold metallo-hydrolase [Nitrososphaerota archaeon]
MIITITIPFPRNWGQGEDTHAYLLKNDEVAILIDAGLDCEDNRKFIKSKMRELEVRNLEYILITHGHIDHFGLAGYLQEETGAEILVHELDGKFLKDYRNALNWFDENYEALIEGGYNSEELKLMKNKMLMTIEMLRMPKYYKTFKNLNNFKLESLHLPGHTAGSVGYVLRDVIFSGDVAIEGGTVVENLRMEINSIQKLKSFKYIFPAHRKTPLLKEDIENLEKHFINRLEELLRIIRNGMRLRDIIRNMYGEEGSFRDLLRLRNLISYLRFLEEEGYVMKRGQFWISIRDYFE